jgi:nitrogen regulatory protein PII
VKKTVRMKRVIIIGDSDLTLHILDEIQSFGPSGYTYYIAHGQGSQAGTRFTHEQAANVKIEVVAPSELAYRILDHIADNYIERYAMIAFIDDVEVLASEKFGRDSGTEQVLRKTGGPP